MDAFDWNTQQGIEMIIVNLHARPELVGAAIHQGFDPTRTFFHGLSILSVAASHGIPILEAVVRGVGDVDLRDDDGTTGLMNAIVARDASLVRYYLSKGASVECQDDCGQTALHYAADVNVPSEVVRDVCEHATAVALGSTAYKLYTPLVTSIRLGAGGAFEELLRAHVGLGVSVSHPPQPGIPTPLQVAVRHREKAFATALIRAGADASEAGEGGVSALDDVAWLLPEEQTVWKRIITGKNA
ncbi:MAG: ankyrin repeat domain-containing protein [Phycisphaerae bacterium]|nr:ankyrin repeat domain-containing protein [Phycisphaerae bacterium]